MARRSTVDYSCASLEIPSPSTTTELYQSLKSSNSATALTRSRVGFAKEAKSPPSSSATTPRTDRSSNSPRIPSNPTSRNLSLQIAMGSEMASLRHELMEAFTTQMEEMKVEMMESFQREIDQLKRELLCAIQSSSSGAEKVSPS